MDTALAASYEECKRLNSLHGKTYYLATLLLPKSKRPYVHALYGFARYADEIVDDLASTLSPAEKADALRTWSSGVLADLKAGTSTDHIGRALVDTARKFNIPHQHFVDFLHSMEMDLTVTEYQTYEDLLEYVYGSAAVIGLEMVPILGYSDERAYEAAKKLGIAFQLANFIRDVGEDLDRGRVRPHPSARGARPARPVRGESADLGGRAESCPGGKRCVRSPGWCRVAPYRTRELHLG